MGDRIAFQAVGTALQDDELGRMPLHVLDDAGPDGVEHTVVGTWWQRDVELGSACRTSPFLLRAAGAGVEVMPVLMDIGKDDARIVLEPVEHAVAVMSVDVDVGNALQPESSAKLLNGNATVVEHTEPGSLVAGCVMQAGDRNEGATSLLLHDRLRRVEGRPHNQSCRVVHATESRCVASVQKALAGARALADEIHVRGRVKGEKLFVGGRTRLEQAYFAMQAAGLEFPHERRMAVRAERVAVTEAIPGQALAHDHCHVGIHVSREPSTRRSP